MNAHLSSSRFACRLLRTMGVDKIYVFVALVNFVSSKFEMDNSWLNERDYRPFSANQRNFIFLMSIINVQCTHEKFSLFFFLMCLIIYLHLQQWTHYFAQFEPFRRHNLYFNHNLWCCIGFIFFLQILFIATNRVWNVFTINRLTLCSTMNDEISNLSININFLFFFCS